MREVRIKSRSEDVEALARLAQAAGVHRLSSYLEVDHRTQEERTVLSAEVSTPLARKLIGAILDAPFYAPDRIAITSREVRAIVAGDSVDELTVPLLAPSSEIRQELWQFSHLTGGLAVRAFAAALLLAYGVLEANLLVIAAGLLFLPATPLFLAIAFGIQSRELPLIKRAAFTLLVITGLLVGGGMVVGIATGGEIRYDGFEQPATGAFLSLAIGVAGAIATGDDVGRRELIGLAAASQFAIVPAWLGLALTRGELSMAGEPLMGFAINVVTLTLAATATYVALHVRGQRREEGGQSSIARRTPGEA